MIYRRRGVECIKGQRCFDPIEIPMAKENIGDEIRGLKAKRFTIPIKFHIKRH